MNLYGFDWGPMSVTRLAHIEDRGYVLEIKTAYTSMQVRVSEKGRKITTYPRNGAPTREGTTADGGRMSGHDQHG